LAELNGASEQAPNHYGVDHYEQLVSGGRRGMSLVCQLNRHDEGRFTEKQMVTLSSNFTFSMSSANDRSSFSSFRGQRILDAIVDNIALTLFLKERQSLRFVRLNRAGEGLLGWPRQTLIRKSDYDLWPQAQADFFVEKDREALNSGTVVDIPEEPVQARDQGVRLLHTRKVGRHAETTRLILLARASSRCGPRSSRYLG